MLTEEAAPSGFVMREAIPTSDIIRFRFADMEGLRALAIFAVSFGAGTLALVHSPSPLLARIAGSSFSAGLALFFALSGFALAYPPFAVLRQDGSTYLDIGRYVIKRVLRIFPAFLVALTIVAALAAANVGGAARAFGTPSTIAVVANVFFAGDAFNNDGFRALGLFARAYIFFPALLWLFVKRPMIFAAVAAAAGLLDIFTPAHAWSVGVFLPFMLGMLAADWRAQQHSFERFAPAVFGIGAILAVLAAPGFAAMPGYKFAPGALAADPFWSLAAFGLLSTSLASRPVERLFSFWLLRVVGAASYSISLVVVPVCLLLAPVKFGAIIAVPVTFIVGFMLWQLVDRWFAEESFRRNVAAAAGTPLDDWLAPARIDRVFLGEPKDDDYDPAHPAVDEEFVPAFYAPPPRPNAADLAMVSRRTGSPEELAAEILETKQRLQERSAALFDPPPPPPPPPAFAKPGFYKRTQATATAAAPEQAVPVANEPALEPAGMLVVQPAAKPAPPPPVTDTAEPDANLPGPASPPTQAPIRIKIGPGDGTHHG